MMATAAPPSPHPRLLRFPAHTATVAMLPMAVVTTMAQRMLLRMPAIVVKANSIVPTMLMVMLMVMISHLIDIIAQTAV